MDDIGAAPRGRPMYVPTFQGLSPLDFLRRASPPDVYPFNAPHALRFFRARNAIYYLFRALTQAHPNLTVLAPDYNSGNEVAAIDAAGARLQYYTVDRHAQLDPDDIERLCELHRPDVLYVVHYQGWPQPMRPLVDLCRRRGMLLVEDCALALLSASEGQPLGTFGDWSVFCLYKTLPVPNGAVLVQNTRPLPSLEQLALRRPGVASALGRTSELLVQQFRGRWNEAGAALQRLKSRAGRAAGGLDIERPRVGDIGFDTAGVDLAPSGVTEWLLSRLDFDDIRRRRVENCRSLMAALEGAVTPLWPDLPEGVCPLFYPILVADKQAAANAFRQYGIEPLEIWNHGVPAFDAHASENARLLRAHVLGLPVHQDLTDKHVAYMADLASRLHLRRS
jgi:dTDP-4-amino-4,6-dideoxygalactose transaminase